MTNAERRLKEYEEYEAKTTRFKTHDELVEFSKNNFVFYPAGFGYNIQSLITTEKEFKDFVQRCCIHVMDNLIWFADCGGNEYLSFNPDPADTGWIHESYLNDEIIEEEFTPEPALPITGYCVDVNPYFEEPFSVTATDINIYRDDILVVNPEVLKQLPALVRFCSMDDFDRMGSIKGEQLEIIPMAEIVQGTITIA